MLKYLQIHVISVCKNHKCFLITKLTTYTVYYHANKFGCTHSFFQSDEEEPAIVTGRFDKAGRSGGNTTGPVVSGSKAQKDRDVSTKPTTSNVSRDRVKDGIASDVKSKPSSVRDSEVLVQSDKLKEIEVEPRRSSPRKGLRSEKDNKMTNSQKKDDRNDAEFKPVEKRVTVERTNKSGSLNTRRKNHSDAEESHYHVNDEERGASTSERPKRTRNETSAARNKDMEGSGTGTSPITFYSCSFS